MHTHRQTNDLPRKPGFVSEGHPAMIAGSGLRAVNFEVGVAFNKPADTELHEEANGAGRLDWHEGGGGCPARDAIKLRAAAAGPCPAGLLRLGGRPARIYAIALCSSCMMQVCTSSKAVE